MFSMFCTQLHLDKDDVCPRCSLPLDEGFVKRVKEAEEMVKAKLHEMHLVSRKFDVIRNTQHKNKAQ